MLRRLGALVFLFIAMLAVPPTLAGFDSAAFNAGSQPLSILRITPDGEDVPPGRQIVFQFNRSVVPVGRMEREAAEIPITITPELDCQWRWLNTSALACQLTEEGQLKPATRYEIRVEPGIAAEDGTTLAEPVEHSFITERPKVRQAGFKTWKSPGMPYIRVNFTQPVSQDSVKEHLNLLVHRARQYRVELKVEVDPNDRELPHILPLPGENMFLFLRRAVDSLKAGREVKKKGEGIEARRVWLVSPRQELPLDTKVDLRVEPGLVSYDGPEKGVEDRVVVSFHTFPEFSFVGLECTDNSGKTRTIVPETEPAQQPRCNPLEHAALLFTAPVIKEEVKNHVEITPALAGGRKDYDPWANVWSYSRLGSPHRQGEKYRVRLPEVLKAYEVYQLKSDPENFKDEFGRTLTTPIDLQFATDHRRPDFTLTHQKAVLEKTVDTEMPLVVTNLDSVTLSYDRFTGEGKVTGQKQQLEIPQAEDVAFRTPLHIRKLLEGKSGVVQGAVNSSPHLKKNFWERWFFAQVTPFQVHAKVGHYSTLVWVTDFATGKPVADARVLIYSDTYTDLSEDPTILSEAVTDKSGIAMLAGTREIDPGLDLIDTYRDPSHPRLFVRVEKANDLALVPLDYDFRVDVWRTSNYSVYPSMQKKYGHIHTWGTTAQGVYRAGDTIQYKLYVRDQDNKTLVVAPREGYNLEVIDPMGKTVYQVKDITLSEFGGHHGEFTVSEAGAVGWYRFKLTSKFFKGYWEPMRVLVSDFTPAPFRVTTDLNGQLFQPEDEVQVTTQASLHAGGPYADAQSRITATLQSRYLRSDVPVASGFYFDVVVPGSQSKQTLHQSESTVDSKGNLVTNFTLPESDILYGRLTVESAVRDDRGKYITSLATADYAGRNRYVGLRSTAWVLHEDEPARVDVLVVDEAGKPAAGTDIEVKIERRETKAARVKGAGNAYLTHYTHEWVDSARCKLASKTEPVPCQFTPQDPGTYRITSTIRDTEGRTHSSEIQQWVVGKGRVLWEEPADNSLQIQPEKESYRVGETARYLVKNPFPGAQALITVERYGVLKSWVQTFASSTPLIEFEVEEDFLPGYFLSVVVMSPRVEKPLGEEQVDLGKPAFRMGYVAVNVIDPYKEMAVKVSPAHETYKPRERVKVNLQATPRHPKNNEPIELAVAVLDESVLDLLSEGRDYFDPYKGFYTMDGLDLRNFSLLLKLVGRQKFEKKGANTGGGGGMDMSLRSVFKFVSYWNPSLRTDARGRATIEFEAPDNLTGWRVLAMAVTPTDRMGLGDSSFKVNRPTEIRPVMPNQVTEGDSFQAGFSIMNRTPKRRELSVTLTAQGAIAIQPGQTLRQVTKTLVAEPYKRYTVWLPLETTGDGEIHFTARGGDAMDRDGMIHTLKVHKRYSLEAAATYGTTVSDAVTERILFPEEIRTDVGGVSVVVSPSVISNLEGAFRYLRDYPYICWEQILTKGVMASHFQNLKRYMPEEFKWDGSENLPQDMLERAAAYQAPNGGMTYYVPQDRYVSPYLSAYTAIAFNWLRRKGYEIPAAVEDKLHDYLLTLLRRDVVPTFYSKGMASTVRAVALAALSEHGKITSSDLERYRPHVPEMSLFGKAHFLLAAMKVQGTEFMRKEVCNLILAHANQSGGKFVFSETIDDSYSRILASPLRANGAILSALAAFSETDAGSRMVADIPFKLVRYITQSRKNRDHWENTQENMFCLNALIDYSRVYEKEKPRMTLRAFLDEKPIGKTSFKDLRDEAVEFNHPIQPDDPGRKATVKLEREGRGRFYYGARLFYAPSGLKSSPINGGIEVHREYSVERDGKWVLLQSPMELNRGELVRVDLYVMLPTARNFVVVDDPVPGGLEPVNRDLATASTVDADKGEFQHAGGSWWFRYSDWSSYGLSRWSFYHQELRHNAARFYSEYLPAGNYHLSYTAQAIAPGEFIVMPVHAEEMYDPDIYGKGVPAKLEVGRD
jgi:uncharacterized protein YfaS (alpha-2-macroglobulin family)